MTVRGSVVLGAVAVGAWLWAAPPALGDDSVTPVCNGQPCATTLGFWYTSPVTLVWQVSQNPMPTWLQGCGTQSYLTDTVAATTSCEAMWANLDDIKRTYTVRVEVSNPTASAALTRPPDVNGWYNHPVAVAFKGSAFSAIASCTPPTAYAGPATPTATVSGSCTDNAGKTATTSVMFPYDATLPSLTIAADPGDRTVELHWSIGDVAPLASLKVTRKPGLRGHSSSVLYRGNGGAYADSRVRNGLRYRYEFTARDQAGNVTMSSLAVTPGPRLLAPAQRAHLSAPPLLQWTPVRGASYYNVQLYRAGSKVLSEWPAGARLQLRRAWRLDGRRYRLGSGTYRWYVWPGFGRPAAAHYGPAIGTRTFVVDRLA
jgi:hypothetical protein